LLRGRFGDPLVTPLRWAVITAAVAGAALGSKILFWFEDPQLSWRSLHDPTYLIGGKTIVGALAFGLLTVELVKRYIGIRDSTGDLYAIPLAVGIAVGRIGCFLTALSDNTYGIPTKLPWAVNFGDGIPRHPTQLYEVVFLLIEIPLLYKILRTITLGGESPQPMWGTSTVQSGEVRQQMLMPATRFLRGDAFKFFMAAYISFRLFCDFIKPYPRIFLGLGGIQWACVALLLYYSPDITHWLRESSSRSQQA